VKKLVQQTAFGQSPFASIVACTDSRSSPEVIFDQNIGDIFVARVAGNVANDDIIGSLEYASKVAGSRVIVVLGHTDCGAVKGACDNVILGNLTGLLGKIQPAVNAAKTSGDRNSKNYEFVEEVTEINVDDTIKAIREHSLILKELEEQGKIKIVGAIYDTSNGKIRWR
jgi:carbonic anhydrase